MSRAFVPSLRIRGGTACLWGAGRVKEVERQQQQQHFFSVYFRFVRFHAGREVHSLYPWVAERKGRLSGKNPRCVYTNSTKFTKNGVLNSVVNMLIRFFSLLSARLRSLLLRFGHVCLFFCVSDGFAGRLRDRSVRGGTRRDRGRTGCGEPPRQEGKARGDSFVLGVWLADSGIRLGYHLPGGGGVGGGEIWQISAPKYPELCLMARSGLVAFVVRKLASRGGVLNGRAVQRSVRGARAR